MPDTTPNNVERDEAFRESMRLRDDGPAKAWVALDDKAQELDQQVGRDEREREGRATSVGDLERVLNDARNERDDFRAENPQPGRLSSERKAWDEQYQGLDNNVSGLQKDFAGALRDSSPEELDAIGKQIDERRAALAQTIAERQGIAKLPSEEAQEAEQASRAGLDNMAARTAQQGQGQEEGEGEARGQGGSFRMRPNYGAYATTVEEENNRKQLEHDQRTVALERGRPGTDPEMQAFERERNERQAQPSQQGGEASPYAEVSALPKRGQDDEKRHEQAVDQGQLDSLDASLETPLAARRTQRQEATQFQGTSTVAERQAKAEQVQSAPAAEKEQGQSQEGQSQARKRDYGQDSGMGM